MKIGMLSDLTQVSTDTLRYYEKLGLIRSARHANGYRDFDKSTVEVVGLIHRGKALGFSLREIQSIVTTLTASNISEYEIETLLREKLAELDAKMVQVQEMQELLRTTLSSVCPLRSPLA